MDVCIAEGRGLSFLGPHMTQSQVDSLAKLMVQNDWNMRFKTRDQLLIPSCMALSHAYCLSESQFPYLQNGAYNVQFSGLFWCLKERFMLPSNGMLIRNLIHETSDVQLIIGRPLSYRKFNIRGNFDVKVVKPLPKLVRQHQSKNCHKAYSPYQHVHQPGGLLTKRSLRGQKKGWVWTNCHAEYGDHGGNVSCRG